MAVPLGSHFVSCTGSPLRSLLKKEILLDAWSSVRLSAKVLSACANFFFPRITLIDANQGRALSQVPESLPAQKTAAPCVVIFAFIRAFRGLDFGCGCAALCLRGAEGKPPKGGTPNHCCPYFNSLLGGQHFSRRNFHLQRPPKKLEQHSDPFSCRQ